MTDKIKDIINNFSDMKIIKALECCIIGDCDNCPFYETRELCPNLILFVSDLIKRQEAEIERLKRKLVGYEPSIDSGLFSQMLLEQKEKAEAFEKKWKAEVKSEAYKECIEKVKEKSKKTEIVCSGALITTNYAISAKNLNNLLKELVGDSNG